MRCPSGLAGHGHCTGCIQVLDSSAQFEESGITAQKETTSELGREEEDDDMALNCAWLLYRVLLCQNLYHLLSGTSP